MGEPENITTVMAADASELPKPEDLVARSIVPVKSAFLRPHSLRSSSSSLNPPSTGDAERNERKDSDVFNKEKKSKRQIKRDRQKDQKSAKNICSMVAKTGDVTACKYGANCRLSHDLDGFLKQKEEDLPGNCPFLEIGECCPYGIACRYSGTHREAAVSATSTVLNIKLSETNSLNKDVQRHLWKNTFKFPMADAQLKLLGLKKGNYSKGNDEIKDIENGTDRSHIPTKCDDDDTISTIVDDAPSKICVNNGSLEDASDVNDIRPQKKAKIPIDEECDITKTDNGTAPMEIEKHSRGETDSLNQKGNSTIVDVFPTIHTREKKLIDFRNKLYLAPLTTVGNLPFRRLCKVLGADITCGEMAMCTNLLQGQASEWALLRRHSSEDIFGVQLCGAYPDTVARTVELINSECSVDFIDINMGCPIDIVVNKGAGSSLLTKPMRIKNIIQAASGTVDKPLTIKVRTGFFEGRNRVDSLIADISNWGASAVTIHGRSRQQRYSKVADWDYIHQCASKTSGSLQVLGNGDIFSHLDWNKHKSDCPKLSTCMIARGALVKPWIFTEIKEERLWDISSGERFDILKKFVHFGLEHWGSDSKGVETTRYFLLEWLSYTYRYVPIALLDVIPQRLNWRPPGYYGRDDLETLMASDSAADWIRISEMLLGKVPGDFGFAPKHKSNAYDKTENG
ncbi:putative tRNA-dihydrouridine synthase [Zostera marina]|uniref:tRNA-dihydrouridine(47) synthase [NAD(P)(+)] n=1 Tax=Zostera marina TaxID=29655 RepID=A0A0K9P6V9_ZOSMR|nr:putative tRNA-dihydrouridine synthase [Zostera marina]